MQPDYELKVHVDDLEDATATIGRPLRTADQWKQAMRDVGFVDVQEVAYKMPINGWAKNLKYKQLGKMWEHNWLDCIHALSVGPLHRVRGLNDKQIQVRLERSFLPLYLATNSSLDDARACEAGHLGS